MNFVCQLRFCNDVQGTGRRCMIKERECPFDKDSQQSCQRVVLSLIRLLPSQTRLLTISYLSEISSPSLHQTSGKYSRPAHIQINAVASVRIRTQTKEDSYKKNGFVRVVTGVSGV
jgi:hypothetical protein